MFNDTRQHTKSISWMFLLPLSILLFLFSFDYTNSATAQEDLLQQCGYAICIDWEKTGSQEQKPSSIFPISVRIEPDHELKIKIFGPGSQMIYEKSFYADENGWVRAEYAIPSNTTEGYYRVYLSTMAKEGKSYYSLLFTIGDPYSNDSNEDRPFHIGVGDATQNGEYKQTFEINKPIDVLFKLSNPYVEVPADVPINIVLESQNNVLDNATINTKTDGYGLTTVSYAFVPKNYGFYNILAKVTYEGFSSEYGLGLKVRPSPDYSFEVEGKKSAVTIDSFGEIGNITSVNLDVPAKKLDIEIAKENEYNILEVKVPYELLSDPYTILTNGELVNLGETSLSGDIYKDYTYAVIRIPVDDSVSHIEIIGTSVIPEFGSIAAIIMALSIVAVIAANRLIKKD